MRFHVITLFPDMFDKVFGLSTVKRSQEKGALEINLVNLRDFALDKYGTVDDKPYGGGTGMLLMPKPIFDAVRSIKESEFKKIDDANKENTKTKSKIILLSPRGQKLTQEKVRELSKLDEVILICGRYEGVDERVSQNLADEELSIGDYVLSGGEIPAMVVVESVARLLPGVLEKEDATTKESFSKAGRDGRGLTHDIGSEVFLEYPQYTRPEDFEGFKVPEILLSGDHAKVEKWRQEQAKKATKEKRPDLIS